MRTERSGEKKWRRKQLDTAHPQPGRQPNNRETAQRLHPKNLAEVLSRGRTARNRYQRDDIDRRHDCWRLQAISRKSGIHLHGQGSLLSGTGRAFPRACGMASVARSRQRRPCCGDDAEYLAISDCFYRDTARRFCRGECQSLYTPRELAHQLNDSGAKALIVLENFAATVEKRSLPQRAQYRRRLDGRHARFQGQHNQSRGAPREEDGACLEHSGACSLQGCAGAGALAVVRSRARTGSDLAFLQYTGGTTGISKGPCSPTATFSPMSSR